MCNDCEDNDAGLCDRYGYLRDEEDTCVDEERKHDDSCIGSDD